MQGKKVSRVILLIVKYLWGVLWAFRGTAMPTNTEALGSSSQPLNGSFRHCPIQSRAHSSPCIGVSAMEELCSWKERIPLLCLHVTSQNPAQLLGVSLENRIWGSHSTRKNSTRYTDITWRELYK